MVGEPGGLGCRLGSLLARPDGSRQVAEVVSDLEGDHHVGGVLLLGDHSDEEADLVGLPEGDHTGRCRGGWRGERQEGEVEGVRVGFGFWGASVDLLWIILEVLRFSQLIVLGRSVFPRQQQLLGGNNNLGTKKRKKKL